ncbi:MAG: hypothetical protein HC902_12735, partial [Calothrix sp. SM1_5_4]|nr:hypothetical protein [Calothrix sp. SM1_5_4]
MNSASLIQADCMVKGVAAKALGFKVATPVFDGIPEEKIREFLRDAKTKDGFTWVNETGKSTVYD